MRSTGKRGVARKRVELLSKLARLVRAPVDAERMLRSIASLFAVEIGQYCIVDFIDAQSELRRIAIEHADASRRSRLQLVCMDTVFSPGGRAARLLTKGGSELIARVERAARVRALGDVVLLDGEAPRSYLASTIDVDGAPIAVVTLVVSKGTRRYGQEDLATLEAAAEWIGLGLENTIRRTTESDASGDSGVRAAIARRSSIPSRPSAAR